MILIKRSKPVSKTGRELQIWWIRFLHTLLCRLSCSHLASIQHIVHLKNSPTYTLKHFDKNKPDVNTPYIQTTSLLKPLKCCKHHIPEVSKRLGLISRMQFPKFPPHTLHIISICFYSCFQVYKCLVSKLQYTTKRRLESKYTQYATMGIPPKQSLTVKENITTTTQLLTKIQLQNTKGLQLVQDMPFYALHRHPLFKISHQRCLSNPPSPKFIKNTKQTPTLPLP